MNDLQLIHAELVRQTEILEKILLSVQPRFYVDPSKLDEKLGFKDFQEPGGIVYVDAVSREAITVNTGKVTFGDIEGD